MATSERIKRSASLESRLRIVTAYLILVGKGPGFG
jgi:hypothetical protein